MWERTRQRHRRRADGPTTTSLAAAAPRPAASLRVAREYFIAGSRVAVRSANEICDPAWQVGVTRLARNGVGVALWASRPKPCLISNCRGLARVARELVGVRGWMHRQVGEATGNVWEQIRGEGFEAKIARHLGRRIPLPTDEAFMATARCLRALGILCCLDSSRDLTECRCLRDMAVDFTRTQLEVELREMASEAFWEMVARASRA